MNGQDLCNTKMFEYLELRSSVLLAEINHLLTQLRGEKEIGSGWRVLCELLKRKQEELEGIFDQIRVQIDAASTERAVKEQIIRPFEATIDDIMTTSKPHA